MSRAIKIWLIVGIVLVLAGVTVCGVVLATSLSELEGTSSDKYESNSYTVTHSFDSIKIITNTSDVRLAASDNGECRVDTYELTKMKHTVSVEDGVLTVRITDTRKWYDHISIYTKNTYVTVYLPKDSYKSLKAELDTGDITVEDSFEFSSIVIDTDTGDVVCDASAGGKISISTDTGDIWVNGVTAGELHLESDTGRISVKASELEALNIDVNTADIRLTLTRVTGRTDIESDTGDTVLDTCTLGETNIEADTGDVELKACELGKTRIETDTGDVEGTLISPMTFVADSNRGKVRVPRDTEGARCEIFSDTGDVLISVITE